MDTKLWISTWGVSGEDGRMIRDLYGETFLPWDGNLPERSKNNPDRRKDFPLSSLCEEITIMLQRITGIPSLILELTPVSTGRVYALYVGGNKFPNSDPIEITDEKLLEKLRSVNGQFTYDGRPIFYSENLKRTQI